MLLLNTASYKTLATSELFEGFNKEEGPFLCLIVFHGCVVHYIVDIPKSDVQFEWEELLS